MKSIFPVQEAMGLSYKYNVQDSIEDAIAMINCTIHVASKDGYWQTEGVFKKDRISAQSWEVVQKQLREAGYQIETIETSCIYPFYKIKISWKP